MILDRLPFIKNRLDFHMREVVSGAAVAFAIRLIGAGLEFGFTVLLARMLGADGTGIYFLAFTVVTIGTVFGRMGLDNVMLRFTAANAVVEDWKAVKGVYRQGIKLAFAASTAAALVIFISAPILAEQIFKKPDLLIPLRWMALAVVPLSLLYLHAESLKGLKRILDSQLVYGVGVPALSLAGVHFLSGYWGVLGAVWAFTIASVITAIAGFWLWKVATPQLKDIEGTFSIRKILNSCLPLFWARSMRLALGWTAPFMLGIWGTKSDVGIFSAALRVSLLMSIFLFAFNSIAAPKFAALYKQRDMDALNSTARKTTLLMLILTSPVFILFFFTPDWVMSLFGSRFSEEGSAVLAILAVGQLINVMTGPVGYLLAMSGNERPLRNNVAAALALNVILNAILIPLAGVVGVALSMAISLAVLNLGLMYMVKSRLGIITIPFAPKRRLTRS
ncbi:MAG: hypothetical protein IEMM0002_0931 [bacterium]|nr:MAG: hypothetical protein IEMM0002_0931 [bacterium]